MTSQEIVVEQLATEILTRLAPMLQAEDRVIFNEEQAAEFLKVSTQTLYEWRRRKVISFSQYPQARKDADGELRSYSLADLLEFRQRYRRNAK